MNASPAGSLLNCAAARRDTGARQDSTREAGFSHVFRRIPTRFACSRHGSLPGFLTGCLLSSLFSLRPESKRRDQWSVLRLRRRWIHQLIPCLIELVNHCPAPSIDRPLLAQRYPSCCPW